MVDELSIPSGPYAGKKAYDMLVQAEAGVMSITGTADAPSRVGISVADIAAGMYAYSGILSALFARERTGAGATLEVSLFDALAEWMGAPAYYTAYCGTEPPRSGDAHATIAPYELFTTGEGDGVYIAIQNDREWRRLCADVLGQAAIADDRRFATNADRVRHRGELRAVIAAVFEAQPTGVMLARLEAAEIACARRNSVDAFVKHPQLAERDRWRTVGSPAGPLRAVAPPVNVLGVEPVMGAIPALGEHTAAILEQLGFDASTIEEWRTSGVV